MLGISLLANEKCTCFRMEDFGLPTLLSESDLVHSSAPGGAESMVSLVSAVVGLQWLHLSLEHCHGLLSISGNHFLSGKCGCFSCPLFPGS